MRMFPIVAAVVVIALIYAFVFEREAVVAAVSKGAEVDPETAAEAEPVTLDDDIVGVYAIRSVAQPLDQVVQVRGQTEADRQVELRAETNGKVISDPTRKGAFVEEGELICELGPGARLSTLAEAQARLAEAQARVPEAQARVPEAQARVEEARARVIEAQSVLVEAQINSNAAVKLSDNGFASTTRVAATEAAVRGAEAAVVSAEAGLRAAESGLETVAAGIEAARAGVQSAKAEVDAVERDIGNLQIKAPFSGLLESDSAELGSLLQPGDACATIIQLDPIILVGFVPETQVSLVEMGAMATASLASGDQVSGEVIFISRSADPTTRTFRVEVEVDNTDLTLRDGQTADIFIQSAGTKAHLLPQSVLTLDDQGTLGVRVFDAANVVDFRPVTLERDTAEGIWLTGLADEVNIIVIGQEYVRKGVEIRPTFTAPGEGLSQ